jgi:GNAT superfamily N-acetyltransferase
MWPQIQRSISSAAFRTLAHSSSVPATAGSADPILAQALQAAVHSSYQAHWTFAAQTAGKPDRQWSLALPGGSSGVLRRPDPADALRIAAFLRSTPRGPVDRPDDVGGLTQAVLDLLWQAVAPAEDAFVLAGRESILGVAQIEREPEVCETELDRAWLAGQGYLPSEVCVGRMVLAKAVRGHGFGHLLKEAQLAAAADAGYRAVVSAAGHDIGLAIARRVAGDRCRPSASGWILVPVPQTPAAAGTASGRLDSGGTPRPAH